MTLRYAILVLLSEEPSHGYRLKRRLEETVGSLWQVNVGQVYQTLAQLDRQGLARSRMEATDQLKVRKVYEITEKGRRALATWLKRRPSKPGPIRPEIVIRLIALESGEYQKALEQIRAEEEVYLTYLERLNGSREPSPPLLAEGGSLKVKDLALDIALCQARAHLGWLRSCREQLERFRSGPGPAEPKAAELPVGHQRTQCAAEAPGPA